MMLPVPGMLCALRMLHAGRMLCTGVVLVQDTRDAPYRGSSVSRMLSAGRMPRTGMLCTRDAPRWGWSLPGTLHIWDAPCREDVPYRDAPCRRGGRPVPAAALRGGTET